MLDLPYPDVLEDRSLSDQPTGSLPAGEVRSLRDMLEINAQSFMNAVMEARRLQTVIDGFTEEQRKEVVFEGTKGILISTLAALIESLTELYASVALIAARRLMAQLNSDNRPTIGEVRKAMADIESRLHDELSLVKLFVLDQNRSRYFLSGSSLLGDLVSTLFPSAVFEMEESAKCLALGRSTASAFHSIRALEVAIRALARFLQIDDPTKPAEKNWGVILRKINEAIDAKYAAKDRMGGMEGAKVEAIYATLDAVKNPWRNATMHVETLYQPHEADHILQCVNQCLLKLAEVCDEDGVVPPW